MKVPQLNVNSVLLGLLLALCTWTFKTVHEQVVATNVASLRISNLENTTAEKLTGLENEITAARTHISVIDRDVLDLRLAIAKQQGGK